MIWNEEKITDVALIGDGAHASIKRVDLGVPYLTSKNFKNDGLDLTKLDYVSEEDYQKHFKEKSKAITKPQENDLVVGIIGTLGSPYLVRESDRFGLSSSVAIIRPNKIKIDPKYLLYWMKSPIFQLSINQIKSGVAQSFLSLGMIGSLPVSYPSSMSTQKKIARILSAYDDLIENNLYRIKLLEEMAKISYDEWFVYLRFPGYENTALNPTSGLPEGWSKRQIKDIGEVVTGKTPPTSNQGFFGDDVPFIKTPDMANAPYVIHSEQSLSTLGANSQKSKYLPKNSLMVSCIGTVGVTGLVAEPSQTNQQINSIVFKNPFYAYYLYCFSSRLKPLLEGLGSNGATMTNVNKRKFEAIEFDCPSEDLLKKFHANSQAKFEAILNLQYQNQRLRKARDILLPRLMTGLIDAESYNPVDLGKEAA